ncbi:MAG: hypothetical protein A2Z47_03695 [Thermodesulfovibrio sp. RBG_19FT_COMBO_42_12]|nr:MAG: hypothetical protein A2Z47_03695 [Thermodesulfovibrio sp. RBG_19FT_COMBO_42_12]
MKLRGHHLICLHFFKGEGYNPEFVKNLREILKRVEAGEELEVCSGADNVCKKCPYLKGKLCLYDKDAEAEIRAMDKRAMGLLRLKTRDRVKWQEIRKRIPEIFHAWLREYCENCDWRKVCEKTGMYRKMQDSIQT